MTKLDDRPEVSVDWELLFGDMPEVACDGRTHGSSESHDDGPAKHYWRSTHDCKTVNKGVVYALCERKSLKVWSDLDRIWNSGRSAKCPCGTIIHSADEWVEYVGPVGGL